MLPYPYVGWPKEELPDDVVFNKGLRGLGCLLSELTGCPWHDVVAHLYSVIVSCHMATGVPK